MKDDECRRRSEDPKEDMRGRVAAMRPCHRGAGNSIARSRDLSGKFRDKVANASRSRDWPIGMRNKGCKMR